MKLKAFATGVVREGSQTKDHCTSMPSRVLHKARRRRLGRGMEAAVAALHRMGQRCQMPSLDGSFKLV